MTWKRKDKSRCLQFNNTQVYYTVSENDCRAAYWNQRTVRFFSQQGMGLTTPQWRCLYEHASSSPSSLAQPMLNLRRTTESFAAYPPGKAADIANKTQKRNTQTKHEPPDWSLPRRAADISNKTLQKEPFAYRSLFLFSALSTTHADAFCGSNCLMVHSLCSYIF